MCLVSFLDLALAPVQPDPPSEDAGRGEGQDWQQAVAREQLSMR